MNVCVKAVSFVSMCCKLLQKQKKKISKVLIRIYLNLATPLINNKRSEVSIHVNAFTNNLTQLIAYHTYQENTNLNNQNNTFTYNFKLYH